MILGYVEFFLFTSSTDWTMRLLVFVQALDQCLQKSLSVRGAGNDPCVHLRFLVVGVVLTAVDNKFESVVTDLEIVCIAAFGWIAHRRNIPLGTQELVA